MHVEGPLEGDTSNECSNNNKRLWEHKATYWEIFHKIKNDEGKVIVGKCLICEKKV